MRRALFIGIAFIFLFNIGGSYFMFRISQHIHQQEIKHRILSGLRNKDLYLIVISPKNASDLNWTKKGKEFQYKNQMFDVVRSSVKEGQTYYYCINDSKEKELITVYTKTHNQKKESDNKLKKSSNDRYLEKQSYVCLVADPENIRYTYLNIPVLINSLIIPSPPPKTV